VPTYTDDMQAIQRMCGWLVQHLGPDYPLHFSRFFPLYRLSSLWQTPAQALLQARDIARAEGLRYVYIGNVRELPGSETQTTWCPHCRRALVERTVYEVTALHVRHGSCEYCGTPIPGVWS